MTRKLPIRFGEVVFAEGGTRSDGTGWSKRLDPPKVVEGPVVDVTLIDDDGSELTDEEVEEFAAMMRRMSAKDASK